MGKLGVLLMVISFAALAFMLAPIFLTDPQPILNILEPILCEPSDTLSVEILVTQDFDGTGYTPIYDCMRPDETTYNVTDKSFIIGAAVFVIPFLIGLFTSIRIFNRNMRGTVASGTPVYMSGTPISSGMVSPQPYASPPPSQTYNFDAPPSAPTNLELTNRLKQLRDAYDAGMITQAEYERTRSDLLKDFSNGA
jgi:hypothetical protein